MKIITRFHLSLFFCVLFCLASFCMLGCESVAQKTGIPQYRNPDFDFRSMRGTTIANAGVVLARRVQLDKFADVPKPFAVGDQAAEWSPILDTQMQIHCAGIELRSYPFTANVIDQDILQSIQENYADHRHPKPGQLELLAKNMPGVSFLLMARVDDSILDGSSIKSVQPRSSLPNTPYSYLYSSDDENTEYAMMGSMGRTITMTIDLYDLEKMRSIWTNSEVIHKNGPSTLRDEKAKRGLLTDSDSDDTFNITGSTVKATPIRPLIENALLSLSKRMSSLIRRYGLDEEVHEELF